MNTSIPVCYASSFPTSHISQDWMMKATSTPQHMGYPSWATYPPYAQSPTLRSIEQQRVCSIFKAKENLSICLTTDIKPLKGIAS